MISNIKTPNLREHISRSTCGDRRGEVAQNGHTDANSSCTTRMQFEEDKEKKKEFKAENRRRC